MAMKNLSLPVKCLCLALLAISPARSREGEEIIAPVDNAEAEPDPFAAEPRSSKSLAIPAERAGQQRAALCLRLETWEGTATEVARWQDEAGDGVALGKLRARLLAEGSTARLVFSPSLGIDQATGAIAESVSERIYPTEYEPPVNPAARGPAPEEKSEWKRWIDAAGDHALPTSFETRNTGQTLEAVAQAVSAEEKCWDVSFRFEVVDFSGTLSHGAEELLIEMPLFGSFRSGGLFRLREGQWRLVSVLEPPRGVDGKASDKRWVTFVRIGPGS